MSEGRRDVVVVGAGVTGLTAAYELQKQRPGLDLLVLERRPEPGGNIRTETVDGFVIDAGPDSFLRTKPDAVALCRELGLDGELITPRAGASKVFMASGGALHEMPAGMALAVPTRVEPLLRSPLLSLQGKLRMLADVVLPPHFGEASDRGYDESIAQFVTRRFGREAADRIGASLLGGIYAGDIQQLSVRSTFPQLLELERTHGSLIRGFLATRRPPPASKAESTGAPPSPFQSLRSGMSSLIEALRGRLPPGALVTGAEVAEVRPVVDGYAIRLARGETLRSAAVILAAPAHAAARMLPDPKLRAELSAIPYVSTATIFFALDRRAVDHPLGGSGFVVPPGEGSILAATWVTSKWDGRAPADQVLLRAFVGGAREPDLVENATDAELIERARAELTRLMGPLGRERFSRVHRYIRSNPQPVVGHAARLGRLRERLAELPGLQIAGAAYDGVGIPDCVRQGKAAARAVLAEVLPRAGVC